MANYLQEIDTSAVRTSLESNRAEDEVSRQVLLVAGVALTVFGGLVANLKGETLRSGVRFLAVLVVVALASSIVFGIVRFCTEFTFWKKTSSEYSKEYDRALKLPVSQQQVYAETAFHRLNQTGSSRVFFWLQVGMFILAVLVLSSMMITLLYI